MLDKEGAQLYHARFLHGYSNSVGNSSVSYREGGEGALGYPPHPE